MGSCNSCPSKGTCGKDEESCGIVNNSQNKIKNIIGVMSGKGGVGKSTVTEVHVVEFGFFTKNFLSGENVMKLDRINFVNRIV